MVPDPDELVLRIKPEPGAELCLLAKKAGRRRAAARSTSTCSSRPRSATSPSPTSACCATRCAATRDLFPNQDAIEETWRIVQPLLDDPPPVEPYEPGTWGPEAAEPPAHRPRRLAQALAAGITPATPPLPPNTGRGYAADFCSRVRACRVSPKRADRAAEVAERGE